jgi:hypothetical protein
MFDSLIAIIARGAIPKGILNGSLRIIILPGGFGCSEFSDDS